MRTMIRHMLQKLTRTSHLPAPKPLELYTKASNEEDCKKIASEVCATLKLVCFYCCYCRLVYSGSKMVTITK